MPLIVQICIVVVTAALVAVAVMTIRLMYLTHHTLRTAHQSLAELPGLIADVRQASARADELLAAFSHISTTVRSAAVQFESIATRSGMIATMFLDEVERPVSRAAAILRATRAGTDHFIRQRRSRAAGNRGR